MPRRTLQTPTFESPVILTTWAESFGEALGRGVARGINTGLSGLSAFSGATELRRGPGRPAKSELIGSVPSESRCKMADCGRPARSKGLCSAHYQAARRIQMAKKN